MAQGTIRKGFFFYFGLFVLLLISIFLICLVIMMFNPGSTVLWMQYFTANEKNFIERTTDESNTVIDYAKISSLEINCSYANVVVQKNREFFKSGVHIINKAKGFSAASTAIDFNVEVSVVGESTLKIDVTEPTGFLFFSKDIKIILQADSDSNIDFSSLDLKINTGEGEVILGDNAPVTTADMTLGALTVETGKGDVLIGPKFNASSLTEFSISTDEGNLSSIREVEYSSNSGKGFIANCDTSLRTNKGKMNFDIIVLSDKQLNIACKKGNVALGKVVAQKIDVTCMQGNYLFGVIDADLSFANSEDSILAPNITVETLRGDFILATQAEVKSVEPKININEIFGDVSVIADKGNLNVKKAHAKFNVTTESMSVNGNIADDKLESNAIVIITNSGNVNLGFLGSVAGNVNITTNSGNVSLFVTTVAKFESTAYVNDGSENLISDSKISISHGLSNNQTLNPLTVLGTSSMSGTVKIKTNSSISYNLVAIESLVG